MYYAPFAVLRYIYKIWQENCKYEKGLLSRRKHHFNPDLIIDMDHMRISGIEPSSVILNQTKYFKRWNVMPKSAKSS